VNDHPGREVRAESHWKTPENARNLEVVIRKRIRRPNFSGFARNHQELGETGSRIRLPDSRFQVPNIFQRVPTGNGFFPAGSSPKIHGILLQE
jgi:hypothetical protein